LNSRLHACQATDLPLAACPSCFCFRYFSDRVSHFLARLALGNRHATPHPAYSLGWDLTFCLGWPWITVFPTSASHVPGITGRSHFARPTKIYFSFTLSVGYRLCLALWRHSKYLLIRGSRLGISSYLSLMGESNRTVAEPHNGS
jgi:hypothetical protein